MFYLWYRYNLKENKKSLNVDALRLLRKSVFSAFYIADWRLQRKDFPVTNTNIGDLNQNVKHSTLMIFKK